MPTINLPHGHWAFWPGGKETVRLIARHELWGRVSCEVLLPSVGRVAWVSVDDLVPAGSRPWTREEVAWRAAATRAIHLAALRRPIALGDCDIEPLPHQLAVVDRALGRERVRLLLADEVGLGKTIEAGLIYRELKARGKVRRVLVLAPKGIQLQWVAEMRQRFGEEFVRVGPGGIPLDSGIDPWRAFDRIVCSFDTVKPMRRRAGWTPDRVAERNWRRFRAIVDAGWDLVVLDEAHHMAGSTEDVARHELARQLASRATHVLLLSATPHSGKTEAFTRLMGLLDPGFERGRPLTSDTITDFVVRTEKRAAVDSYGAPLFQPRTTSLEVVPYEGRSLQQSLYKSVTEYVRYGYNRALRERRPAVGFLLLLMQRLVSSSTAAILAALERRATTLATSSPREGQLSFPPDEWSELTGEEQYEALVEAQEAAWSDERSQVEQLLDLARKAVAADLDAKANHLLDLIREVQRDEGDPSVKFVVFTEFVATQEMLLGLLAKAGISAASINGSMTLEERALSQEALKGNAQVLVSTDAGGEGINLQFAHVVVNYDLPWNPMRIEQRIGRVDRIGQRHPVRAFNLVLENSVDQYVLRILEDKLWRILEELGSDKRGDVLESASRGVEQLFAQAVADPARLEAEASQLASRTRQEIRETEALRNMLGWTVSGGAERFAEGASQWVLLAADQYSRWAGGPLASREDVLQRLPEVSPDESVPVVRGSLSGLFSIWEVRPEAGGPSRDSFAIFVTEEGALRPDLAERLWTGLARETEVIATAPLAAEWWDQLRQLGANYGYAPSRALDPEGLWRAPWLVLRLLVYTRA